MAGHKFLNNFTGGEWSPLLDGRSDLAKYDSACRSLNNFRVMSHGGARFRTGFEYRTATKSSGAARLIPFQFSVNTRFVMEFGNLYVRFYPTGTASVPGTPIEIVSIYALADVFDIQFKQINDVVYLTHPSYPPQKLKRIGSAGVSADWVFEETYSGFNGIDYTWPPMLDENVSTTTLALNVTTGNGTMTAVGGTPFLATHVDSFWEIRHIVPASSVSIYSMNTGGASNSSVLNVEGEWNVTTTNFWNGTLTVERSTDGGSTWTAIRKFESRSDRNVSASGTEKDAVKLRLGWSRNGDPFSGTWVGTTPTAYGNANAKLESQQAYVSGLVRVTGFTSSTVVSVTVIKDVLSTAATEVWSEGAWSSARGYPRAVGLYEQRIIYGGTESKPTSFWGSKSRNFDSFKYGALDDDALAFEIASSQANAIQWIEGGNVIKIGTEGSEVTASSGSREEPITPSNISVRTQSWYGSKAIDAVPINEVILFLQRQGRRVREMTYSLEMDGYVSPDLTLLAEHITNGGVKQMVVARQPDPLVIIVLNDGTMAVMTYDREQNIIAWAPWVTATGDLFESVAVVYGDLNDEIWAVVNRGGNRMIERMAVESLIRNEVNHLDSSKTGTLTGPTIPRITGLSHLEGREVMLVANGNKMGLHTVSGGQIDFDGDSDYLGDFVVGLPYRGIIQPMKLDTLLRSGPSQGRQRRISDLTIRFKDSLGCKFGRDLNNLEEVSFADVTDNAEESPPLFTGDKVLKFPSGHDKSGNMVIVQDDPFPCVVLGLAIKYEVFGP